MNTEISDALWEAGLEHDHQCSTNARHCLNQFKIVYTTLKKDYIRPPDMQQMPFSL